MKVAKAVKAEKGSDNKGSDTKSSNNQVALSSLMGEDLVKCEGGRFNR